MSVPSAAHSPPSLSQMNASGRWCQTDTADQVASSFLREKGQETQKWMHETP